MYLGGKLWNELPEFVQNFTNIEYLNVITKYKNFSLTHDRIDILRFFAISQFLHDVMIIS